MISYLSNILERSLRDTTKQSLQKYVSFRYIILSLLNLYIYILTSYLGPGKEGILLDWVRQPHWLLGEYFFCSLIFPYLNPARFKFNKEDKDTFNEAVKTLRWIDDRIHPQKFTFTRVHSFEIFFHIRDAHFIIVCKFGSYLLHESSGGISSWKHCNKKTNKHWSRAQKCQQIIIISY